VLQALHLQTQGQGGEQETYRDDKRKVASRYGLPTEVKSRAHWSLTEMVRPPR
jgi:hypothetical protein